MKLFDTVYNQLLMKYYKVKCGSHFTCIGRFIIQGHGSYEFGDNLTIYSKETINPIGGNRTVFQTISGGKIIIGNQVGISHGILCSRSEIRIEDNVLIGKLSTVIKEGAFIGAHAIILKGVTIGKRSVIGAGAVVTKDVPDNQIWAGNPAGFLKNVSA